MAAYYNENDKFAAAWLRELIKEGLIADGEVDERSIAEVRPDDLMGFAQCHFFAGIGGWSYALRLAGWPDDRAVWTGSCPCQPWSMAGRSEGTSDPRHLWPTWFGLIRECRPPTIFGEQVASLDGLYWLDLVYVDLEAQGYAIGATDLCAASIGAPGIRQRLWIVADSTGARPGQAGAPRWLSSRRGAEPRREDGGMVGAVANADSGGRGIERSQASHGTPVTQSHPDKRQPVGDERCGCWDRNAFHRTVGMLPGEICINKSPFDYAEQLRTGRITGREGRSECAASGDGQDERRGLLQAVHAGDSGELAHASRAGLQELGGRRDESARPATAGFWRDADWVYCRDGKWRPVEPGTFPLAHGLPARVGRLRGYGNAIVPQVAAEFIGAYMDVTSAGLSPAASKARAVGSDSWVSAVESGKRRVDKHRCWGVERIRRIAMSEAEPVDELIEHLRDEAEEVDGPMFTLLRSAAQELADLRTEHQRLKDDHQEAQQQLRYQWEVFGSCPCGARLNTMRTHPHVTGCPTAKAVAALSSDPPAQT